MMANQVGPESAKPEGGFEGSDLEDVYVVRVRESHQGQGSIAHKQAG